MKNVLNVFLFAFASVSWASPGGEVPFHDTLSFHCETDAGRPFAFIEGKINFDQNWATIEGANGIGGSFGPTHLDLSDVGHVSVDYFSNQSRWVSILMNQVDAKTSEVTVFSLGLQPRRPGVYTITDLKQGSYNPIRGTGGYLYLDPLMGQTCWVHLMI